MATETEEQRDRRIERQTAIIGDLPAPNSVAAERAKWDEKGNLIDEEEKAREQHHRDIMLGRVAPTREDYVDPAFADLVRGANDELWQRQQDALALEAETQAEETVITEPATPMGETFTQSDPTPSALPVAPEAPTNEPTSEA